MKRFLLHIAIFSTIGLVLLNIIGYALDVHFGELNNKHVYHKANWVFKKKGEKIDYVVLGSSRAYNVIDINTIDLATSLNGLNLGESGAAYAEAYILLEHFLRENQTKLVVLCLDYPSLNSAESFSYPFKEYAFLPQFEEDSVEPVFADLLPAYKFWMYKFVKASKYIEFNTKYPIYDNLLAYGQEEKYELQEITKGSKLVNKNQRVEGFKTEGVEKVDGKVKFNESDLKYLSKIVHLCRSKNIKLLGYSAPIFTELYEARGYENINNQIALLAKNLKLDWADYSAIGLSSKKNYFADYSHLNKEGAEIFSKILGKGIGKKLKSD